MVKTPKTPHSKQHRQPVTIELEPGAVSRVSDDSENGSQTTTQPNRNAAVEPADSKPWQPDDGEHGEATAETEPASPATTDTPPRGTFDYSFGDPSAKAEASGEAPAGNGKDGDMGADGDDMPERMKEPVPRGASGLGRFGAGVIGGVVALLGAGALQYAGLLGAPGTGATGVSLDGVNGQIAELRSEITTLKNAGDNGVGTRVDGLSAALDQVKADIVSLKAASESGQGGDEAGLAALSDKVAGIEQAVAALGQGSSTPPADLGPIAEKLAGLEARMESAGAAAGERQSRLAALEQSVSRLSAKVEAQASQPKIALAIAAAALKSALERGAPFSAELDTFAAIAPDAPQLATLRAYAEKGVPTRATLAGEVDVAANAMVGAARPADPNAGFFQRLLSSASSLVEVRPVGAVEGAGVPETVARMEVAVKRGDYAKALAEYDSLPEAAKAAGADFSARLRARLDAEAQLDALISGAMKA